MLNLKIFTSDKMQAFAKNINASYAQGLMLPSANVKAIQGLNLICQALKLKLIFTPHPEAKRLFDQIIEFNDKEDEDDEYYDDEYDDDYYDYDYDYDYDGWLEE